MVWEVWEASVDAEALPLVPEEAMPTLPTMRLTTRLMVALRLAHPEQAITFSVGGGGWLPVGPMPQSLPR